MADAILRAEHAQTAGLGGMTAGLPHQGRDQLAMAVAEPDEGPEARTHAGVEAVGKLGFGIQAVQGVGVCAGVHQAIC